MGGGERDLNGKIATVLGFEDGRLGFGSARMRRRKDVGNCGDNYGWGSLFWPFSFFVYGNAPGRVSDLPGFRYPSHVRYWEGQCTS